MPDYSKKGGMLINKITLNLQKNCPIVDGTSALEYRQPIGAYIAPRGIVLNLDKSEKTASPFFFVLSDEEKMKMKINLKIGIYKQLYANGFINEFQLKKLIAVNGGGDLC